MLGLVPVFAPMDGNCYLHCAVLILKEADSMKHATTTHGSCTYVFVYLTYSQLRVVGILTPASRQDHAVTYNEPCQSCIHAAVNNGKTRWGR